jgi:hypothetical protein
MSWEITVIAGIFKISLDLAFGFHKLCKSEQEYGKAEEKVGKMNKKEQYR